MFQKIIIIGNLGADPEQRYTSSGQGVTSFNLATSRSFKDASGEKKQETTWWRVSAWGKLADICNEYLKKGNRVQVIGRIVPDPKTGGPRIFTNKDGVAGASFELTAEEVLFLTGKEAEEIAF